MCHVLLLIYEGLCTGLLSKDVKGKCSLCPGNKRAQGAVNPIYEKTFIFVNDYSTVKEQQADYVPEDDDGRCEKT